MSAAFQDFTTRLWINGVGALECLHNAVINAKEHFHGVHFNDSRYKDVNGKVCVITGGNAGIGEVTARLLAERGAHVVLACRNVAKARSVAKALTASVAHPSAKVEVEELDLNSLDNVRRFCQRWKRRGLPLDILICNAGLMAPPQRSVSADGFDEQFQVNYLGHWMMAHDMLAHETEKRRRGCGGAADAAVEGTRFVWVSSMTHLAGRFRIDDYKSQGKYQKFERYADAKFFSVMSSRDFQRRFERCANTAGVRHSAVAVHPGVVDTALARSFFLDTIPRFLHPICKPLFPFTLLKPLTGAHTVLYAALSPDSEVAGKYIVAQRAAAPAKGTANESNAARLWTLSKQLTNVPGCEWFD